MFLRRPKPLMVIVTLLFLALTLRLGFWQLDRAEQKRAKAAHMAAVDGLPPVAWQGEVGESVWLRRFVVQGYWQPTGQVFLDNRVEQGRAGFHVLTPLLLADGRWLLINRGWLPKVVGQVPSAIPPTGLVTVTVRLNDATQRYVELAADQGAGVVWQNLNWARYSQLATVPLVPVLAYQLDGQDGLLRNWPAPDLGIEKHYAYAGQWFLFAALAVVLFVILHWKRQRP